MSQQEPLDVFNGVTFDGSKLRVNGEIVSTGVRLEGSTLAAAWVAAIAGVIGTVVAIVSQWGPISEVLHLSPKEQKYYILVERTCPTESVERLERGRVVRRVVTLPCTNRTSRVPLK